MNELLHDKIFSKQVSRCPHLRYGAALSGLAISAPPLVILRRFNR